MGLISFLFAPVKDPEPIQVKEPVVDKEPVRNAYEEWHREMMRDLETALIEKRPEALAEQPALLQKFIDDYDHNLSTYRFECRRWGDHLAVCISREIVSADHWRVVNYREDPGSYNNTVSTVNIGKSSEIRLTKGHPPDLNGYMSFSLATNSDPLKPVKAVIVHHPNYAIRQMIYTVTENNRDHGITYNGGNQSYFGTIGAAQPDMDDQILFVGTGTIISVPHTLGQSVHDMILREIQEGYRRLDQEGRTMEKLSAGS